MSLEFALNATAPAAAAVDCVVVGAFGDGSLTPAAQALDAASGGRIAAHAPTTTEQPAVVEEGAATSPAAAADKAAKKPVAKPRAEPKPVAKITRDPTPLASNEAPKYPPQALRSGVEGSVSVRVEVDADGVPTDVKVVERSGERSRDLDRAVTDTVRKWRFEPAMKEGKAVAGAVVVPVEFKSR